MSMILHLYIAAVQQGGLPLGTWWVPKALPPYNLTGVLRQRNMAQMKEQIKTPERELSDK